MVSEMEGGPYFKLSEVAKIFKCSQDTLRRMIRQDKMKAPSHQLVSGGMTIYLYDEADLKELQAYFDKKRQPQKRPTVNRTRRTAR